MIKRINRPKSVIIMLKLSSKCVTMHPWNYRVSLPLDENSRGIFTNTVYWLLSQQKEVKKNLMCSIQVIEWKDLIINWIRYNKTTLNKMIRRRGIIFSSHQICSWMCFKTKRMAWLLTIFLSKMMLIKSKETMARKSISATNFSREWASCITRQMMSKVEVITILELK